MRKYKCITFYSRMKKIFNLCHNYYVLPYAFGMQTFRDKSSLDLLITNTQSISKLQFCFVLII